MLVVYAYVLIYFLSYISSIFIDNKMTLSAIIANYLVFINTGKFFKDNQFA